MKLENGGGARRRTFAAAFAALALGTAACASTPSTVPTTTTTTTTLPAPIRVGGTATAGSLSGLGPILRIPVVPLRIGSIAPPALPAGSPLPADAVKIGYRQFGSGPELVLVMGEHGSMTWWDPQLLLSLAAHFHVTIFDLPGVGYSARDPLPASIESYADVTAGFVAALGLVTPTVLGWGLGGQVALAVAERHHGLVTRLVVLDASAGGSSSVGSSASASSLLNSTTATTTEIAGAFFPSDVPAARAGWIARIAELPPDDIVAGAISEQARVESAFAHDQSVESGLGSLRLPVLAIAGTEDVVFPPQNTVSIVHGIRHARERLLIGGGYAAASQFVTQFVADSVTFTS